ncbi:hypothetical protein H0H92_013482, partial [Tricholoma furcatifolium]
PIARFTPPPSTPSRLSNSTEAPDSRTRDDLLDDDDEDFWNPPPNPQSRGENDSTPPPSGQVIPSTPTTADRIRVNRKNAVYNTVIGAMRGSQVLEIPRSRPLCAPIDNVAANTRRFNRIVTDIIMRCERLGEET